MEWKTICQGKHTRTEAITCLIRQIPKSRYYDHVNTRHGVWVSKTLNINGADYGLIELYQIRESNGEWKYHRTREGIDLNNFQVPSRIFNRAKRPFTNTGKQYRSFVYNVKNGADAETVTNAPSFGHIHKTAINL